MNRIKVQAIALNTFREAVRNKILYSVVLFAVILVIISAFFGAVSIGSQVKVIKDFGLFALSFFGALITMLAGVSLLNKELKQKTIYNILSKPIDRWQFILGKQLGLALTVSVMVALMGAGLVGFLAVFERQVDWRLFQAIFFILLEVWMVAAITIFFSSLVVTTALTGIFTLATYLAGRSIGYFQHFLTHQEDYPPIVASVTRFFDWMLPDLSLLNVNDIITHGHSVPLSHVGYAILYCACYSTIALLLAIAIFSRREFT